MSHNPEAAIVCPNCGYQAVYNYCAQCGQQTHLHKETFFGLVIHFVAHYFHYDSKFWQTIKTLVTKPGQLTVAYWNKQRARYIPPISLYIFISTFYFIISIWVAPAAIHRVEEAMMNMEFGSMTSVKNDAASKKAMAETMQKMMPAIQKAMQQMPKVFFFLVPFFALLQKLFFIKRKDLFFVDHAVYSLHFHSLGFIIFLVQELLSSFVFSPLIAFVCYLVFFIYSIFSLQRVYNISAGKAIAYSAITGMIYMVIYGATAGMLAVYYMGATSIHF